MWINETLEVEMVKSLSLEVNGGDHSSLISNEIPPTVFNNKTRQVFPDDQR
jgi:hypothetical protein